ncbi:MAG: Gfo/Idh/MocA family oxidoreductase [Treponema sp.]|nr:Gfo/Idh/MocA family oxidoreductase [Treponema sp.]
MAQDKVYSAAIIGLGRIGYSLGLDKKREQPASHTMALLANSRIKIVAGCDKNTETFADWQKAVKGAAVYTDSSELYRNHAPDIITIAVNESAHLNEAIRAINAKPRLVILEKPVALNMKEALLIKEASEKNNVPVLVNHERRFSEDYAAAKKFLSEIGELQEIKAGLYSALAVYNAEEEKTGAYSLLHDGTHLVDILLYFLEDQKSPSNLIQIPEKEPGKGKKEGNDIFFKNDSSDNSGKITVNSILNRPELTGIVRDEFGKLRQVNAFYRTHLCPSVNLFISGRSKFFQFELVLTGTEGRVCIGNGYCKLYRSEESPLYERFHSLVSDKSVSIPKKTLYFSNMIKNAVAFLDGKEELRSSLQTGMNALAILEEIKRRF